MTCQMLLILAKNYLQGSGNICDACIVNIVTKRPTQMKPKAEAGCCPNLVAIEINEQEKEPKWKKCRQGWLAVILNC